MSDINEEAHEDRSKATEIMTFVLTREDADAFREKMRKESRKKRWSDIIIRVFA